MGSLRPPFPHKLTVTTREQPRSQSVTSSRERSQRAPSRESPTERCRSYRLRLADGGHAQPQASDQYKQATQRQRDPQGIGEHKRGLLLLGHEGSVPQTAEAGLAGADMDDGSGNGLRDGGVTIDDRLYFLGRNGSECRTSAQCGQNWAKMAPVMQP